MIRLASLLIALAFVCTGKAEETGPYDMTPEQEAALLRTAEADGLAMFRHDRAGALANDAVARLSGFRRDRRVAGWVTQDQGNAIAVAFIGGAPYDPPQALYRVVVGNDGKLVGKAVALAEPEPLTDFEAAAATARSIAVAAQYEPCSTTYNTVVVPVDPSGGTRWVAYLLPATNKRRAIATGGTYRIEIDTESRQILAQLAYTRSCVRLEDNWRAVGLAITNPFDAVPTEAHVFWSLAVRKPLFVSTSLSGAIWSVERGKIALVQRTVPKQ